MPIQWFYLLILFLLLVLLFSLFYTKVENFFVFFPQSSFDFTPEGYGLDYKDIYFETNDGKRLHGWFFPVKHGGPTLLFCHGNAGNISHRLDNIRYLLGEGLQVFIFDYRGYGKSSGRPSEQGLYQDGLAAFDHLVRNMHVPPEDIIPFGRSLGAAVAIEVAMRRRVTALIVESAFTSTRDMAKRMLLFLPLVPFLPANYDNLEKIRRLPIPKLIIHGELDEIVPFSMGKRLFDSAPPPKYFLPLTVAGHNDTYVVGGKGYFDKLALFAREKRL
jgi:fermentation-respiration switch protein FrsA (DUF1100 family)